MISRYNKKGNAIIDVITVLIILFAFVIFIFFGKYIFNIYNEDVQADEDMHAVAKEIVGTQHARYSNFFDGLFLFFFILVWGLVLVASFKTDTHPIFFIFTIILLIVVFIIAAHLGNAYGELADEEEISEVVPSFPMANWIMSHLLMVAIVIGFSIVIVLFGKNQANQ